MSTPNTDFIRDFLLELLQTPSPTGNTDVAIELVEKYCAQLGLETYRTPKRSLVAKLPSQKNAPAITVASHVDTLGAMVREIKGNGRLKLTMLGGYLPASVVGEYCTIETASGKTVSGTVLLTQQSVHIHGKAEMNKLGANMDNLEVRLDARTTSEEETKELGIAVGDFVSWDTRTQYTEAGFIKSRHLDNKAGVAASLGAAEMMIRSQQTATQPTYLYFSNYEEVGHGAAAGIPADTEELLVIDMAPVGSGQSSDEFGVSICVKDSGGPYDLHMKQKLVKLAEAKELPYNLDVYVHYGSDGTAALFAGVDARVGLIGPGIDASHAYERTHLDSILNSVELIVAYLTQT
ncbi:M42 family metallopeptidase [Anaerolineales bacterium HSG25]|nr:M42 family metallopeptidase [Anaerolineales bacterium HSG25]